MDFTEEMLTSMIVELNGSEVVTVQDENGDDVKVDFTRPWKRIPMLEELANVGGSQGEAVEEEEPSEGALRDEGDRLEAALQSAGVALGGSGQEALRGEVDIQRFKKHYFQKDFNYESSITPDTLDVVRRAATGIFLYFWERALFAVQYEGMEAGAIVAAIHARGGGFVGGMPPGAVISAESAFARWWMGERAYLSAVDAFTEGDVGRRVVVSGKYATEVRVDGVLRLVQWRGGWRPEYDAGCESATFEVASIGEDAVALRRLCMALTEAPLTEAPLTEAAASTDVMAEAEAAPLLVVRTE